VGKDGSIKLVSAPIGTHVKDILEKVGATVKDGDRIIFGGPMTGVSIYSLDHPVEPDTDTIIVQDKDRIYRNR
jgi:Na+-translocating ferredoxin:NAD+ oxidoreductase subunit C